ncbi:hypothetical protein KP79_PYT04802 [Mizuhopecten yessoensis]|uniref:Uncharacterized protein n=1 Tax=Mizuhopecten yessoensis TaxID=6573 RepID=A0A210QC69_MIZYE|nr:hypothetical protein KP79_PYT04802 [Mizuhopecten yessoensis]
MQAPISNVVVNFKGGNYTAQGSQAVKDAWKDIADNNNIPTGSFHANHAHILKLKYANGHWAVETVEKGSAI